MHFLCQCANVAFEAESLGRDGNFATSIWLLGDEPVESCLISKGIMTQIALHVA